MYVHAVCVRVHACKKKKKKKYISVAMYIHLISMSNVWVSLMVGFRLSVRLYDENLNVGHNT